LREIALGFFFFSFFFFFGSFGKQALKEEEKTSCMKQPRALALRQKKGLGRKKGLDWKSLSFSFVIIPHYFSKKSTSKYFNIFLLFILHHLLFIIIQIKKITIK
jgi:hypothetical protein